MRRRSHLHFSPLRIIYLPANFVQLGTSLALTTTSPISFAASTRFDFEIPFGVQFCFYVYFSGLDFFLSINTNPRRSSQFLWIRIYKNFLTEIIYCICTDFYVLPMVSSLLLNLKSLLSIFLKKNFLVCLTLNF